MLRAPGPGQQWLGILIMVPSPLAEQALAIRQGCGDPLAAEVGPHVTVCAPFIVQTKHCDEVVNRVAACARAQAPFTLTLDGSQSFRPTSPVSYLKVTDGAYQCGQLAGSLHAALGIVPTFDYHPHVTVAHGLDDAALDAALAAGARVKGSFRVDAIDVLVHDDRTQWQPRAHLGLGATGEDIAPCPR